jgi:hypothetical protein
LKLFVKESFGIIRENVAKLVYSLSRAGITGVKKVEFSMLQDYT